MVQTLITSCDRCKVESTDKMNVATLTRRAGPNYVYDLCDECLEKLRAEIRGIK